MMKRKILAVTIPVVGCLTVVGAGFSAWYFSTATGKATDEFGVNINVTEEVKDTSNTLKILNSNAETLDTEYLILDQGGVKNKTDATKGIMFAASTVNETVDREISYTFDLVFDGDTDLTLNKIYDAKMEVALSVSFDLGDGLGAYLETAEDGSISGLGNLSATTYKPNDTSKEKQIWYFVDGVTPTTATKIEPAATEG